MKRATLFLRPFAFAALLTITFILHFGLESCSLNDLNTDILEDLSSDFNSLFSDSTADASQEPTLLSTGNISDTLEFDDIEWTVTSYTFSHYCGDIDKGMPADDGNVHCVVYLNAKNISKSQKTLSSFSSSTYSFKLIYKDGYTYYSSFLDRKEFLGFYDTISALEILDGVCLSFEVPLEVEENESEPLFLTLAMNSRYDTDYVKWQLR